MLLRRCLLVCCALLGFMAPLAYANTEPRLALLIGNAAYKASPLANPVNDVRLMEGALKEAGFTVIKAENASIRDMRRLVRDFGDKLKASGGVGLFYFAGHGVQVRGENFLVSTDSDIRNEDEVADEALNASVILEKMQTAGNRMNLIILDACRNNPFAVKSRSASSGLATMSAPSGSLVAYSTAPGSVASDGSGKNGLYTEHLAKVLRQPGLPVEEVFKQVRAAVRKDSNNQQTPWENTALEGQFYFKLAVQLAAPAPSAAPAAAATTGGQSAPDPAALELAFWDSVKNSQRPGELQAYIERFPNGTFAMLAKSRLQELPGGAAKPASVVPGRIKEAAPGPEADTSIGTLVLTDSRSGVKSHVEVTVKASTAESTVYSTGDEIAKDGRVLRIALGDALLRVVSGALWTIPVKAGTEGDAKLERLNVDYKGPGSLSWRAVSAGDNKVRIDATVTYPNFDRVFVSPLYGKLQATYSGNQPLPSAFTTQIKGWDNFTGNHVSAELKLR
jgi:Caspase domain